MGLRPPPSRRESVLSEIPVSSASAASVMACRRRRSRSRGPTPASTFSNSSMRRILLNRHDGLQLFGAWAHSSGDVSHAPCSSPRQSRPSSLRRAAYVYSRSHRREGPGCGCAGSAPVDGADRRVVATLMVVLDVSIVNIALPQRYDRACAGLLPGLCSVRAGERLRGRGHRGSGGPRAGDRIRGR